jgi:tetratricopeptide (TPR) repeat protein
VNRTLTQVLLLLLLATGSFSLATMLQSGALSEGRRSQSDSVLKVLLGDGRRIFANHAFVQADVYFHSGYYPSVFDQKQAPTNSSHMTAAEGSQEEEEHERQMNFLGPPHDWIEGFGRHFLITEHTHLQAGQESEILPWLKLSAELDPQRIDTYTTAAYFLRKELNKPDEAEKFLHEGIRNNPGSYELLYELGRLYHENYHDDQRARNVWQLAMLRWQSSEAGKKDPDMRRLHDIAINLARLEEQAGNLSDAIMHLELAARLSPNPTALRQQVEELKARLKAASHNIQSNNKP